MVNLCTICNAPGIPGLIQGAGKCQYHYDVGQFGQAWADYCHKKQCFVDLEGTIEAKPGDRVALYRHALISGNKTYDMMQPVVSRRPVAVLTERGIVPHCEHGTDEELRTGSTSACPVR